MNKDLYFLKNLDKYFAGEHAEVLRIVAVIALIVLFIVLVMVFGAVENSRFRRWYRRYGEMDTPIVRWRTIIPWHKTGSKWYLSRLEEPAPVLDRKTGRVRNPYKMSGNSFAIHRARRGGGNIGDGSGNSIGR